MIYSNLPGVTEENYEIPQGSWCIDRDWNLAPPECKSRTLPLAQSVRFEAFALIICNELFSGDQPCKYGVSM